MNPNIKGKCKLMEDDCDDTSDYAKSNGMVV